MWDGSHNSPRKSAHLRTPLAQNPHCMARHDVAAQAAAAGPDANVPRYEAAAQCSACPYSFFYRQWAGEEATAYPWSSDCRICGSRFHSDGVLYIWARQSIMCSIYWRITCCQQRWFYPRRFRVMGKWLWRRCSHLGHSAVIAAKLNDLRIFNKKKQPCWSQPAITIKMQA